ncbi:MAG: hypothetical protein ACP5KD_04210 [Fervidobacterium sp.]
MGIEREKKYLVSEQLAQILEGKSIKRLGVIQWYFDSCPVKDGNKDCRIRYTVDEEGNEEWIVAFKSKVGDDFTRKEEEFLISPQPDLFEKLSKSPVVVKIRYFLSFKPAEVVLDEFLQIDVPYKVAVKYLAEIETDEGFENYEKFFQLSNALPLNEFETYTNKNISVVSNIPSKGLIELVKKKIVR